MADETSALPAISSSLRVTRATGAWAGLPGALLIAIGVLAVPALAQRTEPGVGVPATIVAGPASQSALTIQVGPPGSIPKGSFVRVRGLPPSVALTEGYSIGPGSWAVPLHGLPSLKINIPAGVAGRSELVITLVGVDGTLLGEAHTSLVVAAAPAAVLTPFDRPPPGQVQSHPDFGRPPAAAARPALSAEEKQRVERLLAQGERYLSQGNVEIARQFFERVAEAGYAPGALKLAATFDPVELALAGARSVVPDRAQARKWYERARELGAAEAADRLVRLSGN